MAAVYSIDPENMTWAYAFSTVALTFLIISLIKSEALLPFNKLWMRFGLVLSMIVGPVVLGVIFFGLFTPTATLMRLSGRDELRLKFTEKTSHWIARSDAIKPDSFKQQF
jgi:hypothetical protein